MPPFTSTVSLQERSISFSNRTLDDCDSSITYTPHFRAASTEASSDCFEQTLHTTDQAGATATFTFSGTALYIYGVTGPSHGSFTVQVEGEGGKVLQTVDSDRPAVYKQWPLFSIDNLAQGPYKVVLKTLDDGKTVSLDKFVYTAVVGAGGSVKGGALPASVVGNQGPTAMVQTYTTPIGTMTTTDVFGQVGTTVVYGVGVTTIAGVTPVQDETPSNSDNGGAIAGGVLGVVAFLVLCFYILRPVSKKKS